MKTTRPFMRSAWTACVLTILILSGCVSAQQTMLGQESDRKPFGKGRFPGFASTTKPEVVSTNRYAVDLKDDPNAPLDPSLVCDVRIIGNVQIGAKDILKIIKTTKGRPFSESTLEEDKRALMQKGWFIDVKPKIEKTLSGYIVTFQFIERPILHYVKVVGNKAHTKKILLEEANIKAGDALDPIAVRQAAERIEQFYRDSGYYRVYVEILCGDQIGDRGAVFLVSEGAKQRVLDVEFEGNQIASSARLKTQIQSKRGFFWLNSEFTRKKVDEDVETLTAYYRKLGYFYAKVDREFVETDGYTGWGQNRNWVKVKFIIEEGPRCRVRDVRFVGQKAYSDEYLRKTMKLPKEKYFSQDMLEVDMARIKDEYGKLGYVFAQTTPDPRIDEDFVDVVINVKEGPRCYLNTLKVEIVGNEGTDSYTKWHPILNRMSLRPGDVLNTKEINASKRRLMASQLFNTNPTQGAMPDIIFSYPEEAIEDEERAAALAAAEPQIRGQTPARYGVIPYHLLAEYWPKPKEKRTEDLSERDLETFSNFFRIRTSPQTVSRFENSTNDAIFVPTVSEHAAPPINTPADTTPETVSPYQPMQTPVRPLELNRNKPNENPIRMSRNDDVYRGQFVDPRRPATSGTIVPASYTATSAGNSDRYVPPEPIRQVQYAAPAPTSVVASAERFNAVQNTVQNTTQNTVQNNSYPDPLLAQYKETQARSSGGAPANIAYPTSGSSGTQGTYGSLSTLASNPYATEPESKLKIYTPPEDLSQTALSNTLNNYIPPTYLTPQTDNQHVGAAGVYNQGVVFAQYQEPTANTPAPLYLGAPTDGAIGNSAYGFNPNDPYGGKTYPADMTVRVQETRTGNLMMSIAVSSDSGLMGRFVIEEQNFDILNLPKGWRWSDWKNAFRGKGQRFRIEAVPGTDVQRYSASWETPYLFDLDYSFGVSGFYYERYYDEWYETRVGGALSFGKLWTPDFSTRLSLGGQNVKIYRPIQPTPTDLANALGEHPMYTIGLEATHDTRDSEFMPTEGHSATIGVEQVLGDYQFVRGNIDLRKYFMLHERPDRSGRWVLGLRSSMGISESNAPIYERYFGGGFTNLRGFEFRGVSPRDPNGIITGGCFEFYNSAELIFPITADDMIRGSVFIDTGTVERSISKWESDYRVSVGFGLRLTIPMMGPAPIALDFAFPISRQKGDEKQVFSFNIGFMR